MKRFLKPLIKTKLLVIFLIKEITTKRDSAKKTKAKSLTEMVKLFFTDYSLLTHYYIFELNNKEKSVNEFMSKKRFFNLLDKTENKIAKQNGVENVDYSLLIKDKFCSSSILLANGIPCVQHIAFLHSSLFIFPSGAVKPFDVAIVELSFPIIIKNTIKEYNEGFNLCEFNNGVYSVNGNIIAEEDFQERFKFGTWVVQPLIQSHKAIRNLNKSALNTTRIVTKMHNGEVRYFGGYQAIAVGDNPTDSWGNGAIYVGFCPKQGILKGVGYYHPKRYYGETTSEYPDCNIPFEGYKIPYLTEAVELCCKAHRLFPFTFIIGWDVAITDNGPYILEGNERPGMNAFQLINGGLSSQQLNNN